MTDAQAQIDSRWLIYADGLQLLSVVISIWFVAAPVVGGLLVAAGVGVGLSIALASLAGAFFSSVAVETRARKIRRVVAERRARLAN